MVIKLRKRRKSSPHFKLGQPLLTKGYPGLYKTVLFFFSWPPLKCSYFQYFSTWTPSDVFYIFYLSIILIRYYFHDGQFPQNSKGEFLFCSVKSRLLWSWYKRKYFVFFKDFTVLVTTMTWKIMLKNKFVVWGSMLLYNKMHTIIKMCAGVQSFFLMGLKIPCW